MANQNQTSLPVMTTELTNLTLQWLKWQCQLMSDVKLGVVYILKDQYSVEKIAQWPDSQIKEPARLEKIALEMLSSSESYIFKDQCIIEEAPVVCEVFSLPIKSHSKVIGSASLLLSLRSEEQKKAVLQLFQWGLIWLEKLLANGLNEVYKADAVMTEMATIVLQDEPRDLMAHRVCNAVQKRFQCHRVALGLMQGMQVKLEALSEQIKFDKNSQTVRTLEVVMEECAEQAQTVFYSNLHHGEQLTLKHMEFSKTHRNAQVLSVPLLTQEGEGVESVVGVLLLQRENSVPFHNHEVKILEHLAGLMTMAVKSKPCRSKNIGQGFAFKPRNKLAGLFGYRYFKLKMLGVFLLLSAVLLSFIQTEQKVYAKSAVVGSVQYQIVAPEEGYIENALVRAGDQVKANEVMLQLDRKELLLEEQRLEGELSKISRNYQQALAMRERAKVGILLAEKAETQARLDLIEAKLKRSVIKAPIDGLVIAGDLSQQLGAPVQKGQVLFELAPLENYRVILLVDEHDVAKVAIGQSGSLRLAGLPYSPLEVKLTRITAQSEAQDGGNYFRIEADISASDVAITPGMQGVSQIEVGQASVLWVWAHSTIDRLRLWIWSLGL